jgi:hypothetical protein
MLEVLSKEGAWFWVLIARDSHGTQRAGWVRESDVEFLDAAVARFFLPPAPVPGREALSDDELAADATPGESPSAETPLAETAVADAAALAAAERLKAEEKPKKVDDRKLRKAAVEYEKALQAYEKLQFSMLATVQPLQPVGEPIVEPLYSLPE